MKYLWSFYMLKSLEVIFIQVLWKERLNTDGQQLSKISIKRTITSRPKPQNATKIMMYAHAMYRSS